jgi:hypothetical protein
VIRRCKYSNVLKGMLVTGLTAVLLPACVLVGNQGPAQGRCDLTPGSTCVGKDLRNRDLRELDLSRIDFRGANLSGAAFSGSYIWLTNFTGADLTNADFSGSTIIEAYFEEADLKGASFDNTRLSGVNLNRSDLSNASFRRAILSLSDVTDAFGVDISEAVVCDVYDGETIVGGVCDPEDLYESGGATGDAGNPPASSSPGRTVPDPLGSVLEVTVPLIARNLNSNPVKAARVYAYIGVAAAIASGDALYADLLAEYDGVPPRPDNLDSAIAVAAAATSASWYMLSDMKAPKGASASPGGLTSASDDVLKKIVYHPRDSFLASRSDVDTETMRNSLRWGARVGHAVTQKLAAQDGAAQMPTVQADQPVYAGDVAWEPAPPSRQPPLAPGWGSLTPLLGGLESCILPGPFAGDVGLTAMESVTKAMVELVGISRSLSVEEKSIARFWDDSVGSSGTPAGHWIGIARIAIGDRLSRQPSTLSLEQISRVYADLAVAMHNAAILAWEEKFKWGIVRPVTLADRLVAQGRGDVPRDWRPYLASPPHPEYPSGHAAISAAAASVLEEHLGATRFTDPGINIELQSVDNFDVRPRSFSSFREAANEAAYSRVLGGIHFRFSERDGIRLGNCVADALLAARSR